MRQSEERPWIQKVGGTRGQISALAFHQESVMSDRTISAVFDSREEAERALSELRSAGINDDSISIVGRHWLTPDWAIAWEIGTHEQGDLYRRTGGRLGLRYRF